MEDTGLGHELDQLEADYALRLSEYAPEAVSVLRGIMNNESESANLRAAIARNIVDMAYRAEVWKSKQG